MPKLFGISRTTAYRLVNELKIQTEMVSLSPDGSPSRLVSVPSVHALIEHLASNRQKINS